MPSHPGDGSERSADLRPPWSRSDRRIPRRVVRPLQSFAEEEAASGVVLLAAAVAALVWANLDPSGYFAVSHRLHFVVNDIAMAFFFRSICA